MNSPILPFSLPEDPGPNDRHLDSRDLSAELAPPVTDYLTQVDINHVLGNLFAALAANRISAKRAGTLAYICANLLKSQQGMRDQVRFLDWTAFQFLKKALHEKYGPRPKPKFTFKSAPKPASKSVPSRSVANSSSKASSTPARNSSPKPPRPAAQKSATILPPESAPSASPAMLPSHFSPKPSPSNPHCSTSLTKSAPHPPFPAPSTSPTNTAAKASAPSTNFPPPHRSEIPPHRVSQISPSSPTQISPSSAPEALPSNSLHTPPAIISQNPPSLSATPTTPSSANPTVHSTLRRRPRPPRKPTKFLEIPPALVARQAFAAPRSGIPKPSPT